MRVAPLLLAPLLLAGCSSLGESIFGGCGPHDTVTWRDPALYEALARVEHVDVATTPGLADAAPLGANGGVVTLVAMAPRPGRDFDHVRLGGGTLHAQAATDDAVRAILAAFLANLSALDERGRDALVRAALANKTESLGMYDPQNDTFRTAAWEYTAAAGEAWRVDELLAEHAANASASADDAGIARYRLGSYDVTVSLPVRTATLDGIPFATDSAGFARAVPGERNGGTQDGSVQRVRAALEAHGLPAPAHVEVRTMVC